MHLKYFAARPSFYMRRLRTVASKATDLFGWLMIEIANGEGRSFAHDVYIRDHGFVSKLMAPSPTLPYTQSLVPSLSRSASGAFLVGRHEPNKYPYLMLLASSILGCQCPYEYDDPMTALQILLSQCLSYSRATSWSHPWRYCSVLHTSALIACTVYAAAIEDSKSPR